MENRNQPNRQSIKGIGKQFIKEEIQLAKKHFKIFFLIMEMRAKKMYISFSIKLLKIILKQFLCLDLRKNTLSCTAKNRCNMIRYWHKIDIIWKMTWHQELKALQICLFFCIYLYIFPQNKFLGQSEIVWLQGCSWNIIYGKRKMENW